MKNIKKLRLAEGLTQAGLAYKCGVSLVTARNWEMEVQEPTGENLERLKTVLKVEGKQ